MIAACQFSSPIPPESLRRTRHIVGAPRAKSNIVDFMDWQRNDVKIAPAGELDLNTPQTPGMTRAAAITHARTGAHKLWAGTMLVRPSAKTGPHRHGELETGLYILRGRARMRWGDHLEFRGEAGPGDFIYIPLRTASGNQRPL